MKKLLVSILALSCVSTAFAYDKGEMYVAPALGYHIFDNDFDADNSVEGAIRLGRFFSNTCALEGEFGFTTTDKDNGEDMNASTVALNGLYHFNTDGLFRPYVLLGVSGQFYDEARAAIAGGVGVKVPFNKTFGLDLRVKDILMTDSFNDIIPSAALTIAFGKPAPAVKAAPAPAPVAAPAPKAAEPVKEEAPAAPAKVEAAPAPAAVVVAPVDSDKDGVIDEKDQCPSTPAGAPVDIAGCPLDSDGDGVFDYLDKCPGTKAGLKVNAEGCFIAVTLHVNFKTNSNIIADGYDKDITEFAAFLNANPSIKVEIQGHTDSDGNDVYNKNLSQKRADSVVKELVKNGVAADRLTGVGYGESQPIVPNDTAENKLKNRRVEAVVK